MPPATMKIGALSDMLVQPSGVLAQDPPVDALAGFDVVAQFSLNLLNLQVVRSLAQHGLSSLRAYVPWGSIAVPPSVLAVIPQQLQLMLATVPARFEVRLTQPSLMNLHWPVDITGGTGGGSTTVSARRSARGLLQRTADIAWRVELNLQRQRLDTGVLARPSPVARRFPGDIAATTGVLVATDDGPPNDDSGWDRLTLASGRAITTANVTQNVPAGLWRFGLVMNFADAAATVTAENADVVTFLQGDTGKALLTQALAPLKAASGVRLSPPIAPAGALTQAAVTHTALPAFSVSDSLLTDRNGRRLLSIAAHLAGNNAGVLRLVQPLLNGQDFAYAVSEAVLRPAYKLCWTVASSGLSVVGDAPVELPVGDDPNVTATGKARVLTSFASTLDDASIKVTSPGHPDAVRLMVQQHVQLLRLWDHSGKEITKLGDLGKPADVPTVLPIGVFEKQGAGPDDLNPNFRDLLLKLSALQLFPTLEPFPARIPSVSGYVSSALKVVLVRWSLKPWLADVGALDSGLVLEVA